MDIIGGEAGTVFASGNSVKFSVTSAANIIVDLPLSIAQANAQIANDPNLNAADQIAILRIAKDQPGQATALGKFNVSTKPPSLPVPQISEVVSQGPQVKTPANNQSVGPTSTIAIQTTANVLHDYASYTYNLSLSAMTPKTFATINATATAPYIPENVLIASAGRWPTGGKENNRNQYFKSDFFFDRLEFITTIGMSAQSQNSNSLNGTFTIIEPYGMTLLDNLLQMANHLKETSKDLTGFTGNSLQLPYLLMIDFFGYDDSGTPKKIVGLTKYIPINILEIKMKVSEKGATYDIAYAPFNHQAFTETTSSTPAKFEISAKNLQEFFLSDPKTPITEKYDNGIISQTHTVSEGVPPAHVKYLRERVKTEKDPGVRKTFNDVLAQAEKNPTVTSTEVTVSKEVKSYTGAVNSWKKASIPKDEIDLADIILFDIDDKILANNGGEFPDAATVDKENKAFGIVDPANKDKSIPEQSGLYTNVSDKRVLMSINEGTSILEVIKLAVTNSHFIRDQILDLSKDKFTKDEIDRWITKPFSWFKVTPKISLGKFDKVRNRFQKTITYVIRAYDTINYKSSAAPQGPIPNSFVCKDYQYIFTGQNNDILNFDLNFDTQFYILQQVTPEKQDQIANSQVKTPSESKQSEAEETTYDRAFVQKIIDNRANGIIEFRPKTVLTGGTTGQSLSPGSKSEIIKQVAKNVLTTPGGDMINVKLKIVGDPDFIKQDDFFYGMNDERKSTTGAPTRLPGGSLATDANEIFVNLTFKTPTDYDSTGLASVTPTAGKGNSTSIIFSGRYKVLTVTNFFTGGKFEQELDLIRQPDQPTSDTVTQVVQADRPNNAPATQPKPPTVITSKPTAATAEASPPSSKAISLR